MKSVLSLLLTSCLLIVPAVTHSLENNFTSPNEAFLKACDAQWNADRQGHNTHIGKMVCSCVNYLFNQTKPSLNQSEWNSFIIKTIPNCVTSGVFANTVSRAIYNREIDAQIIENICDASWISLMKTYNPGDAYFNSKKICQCATPLLTQLVTEYDTLPPQTTQSKILGLVNQCDIHKLPPSMPASLPHATTPSSKGVFSLEIKPDKDPELNAIAHYLKEHDMLRKIVAAMNQNIKTPENVHIVTTVTNMGPYYDRDKKTIYLDYELMSIILALYDKYYPKASTANKWHYFNNVTRFLLYHELGHAVINLYHLPVLGQEEDAADALGAIIALNYLNRGYHVLLDSADFFNLMNKTVDTEKMDYWNEHALNKQRYYRLLCYAYGKYPKQVNEKIHQYYRKDLDDFIKDRSEYCRDEYSSTYNDWMGFLKPYFSAAPTFTNAN